jgi:hypothetical protein
MRFYKPLIAIFIAATLSSCFKDFQHTIAGNGKMVTESRTLSAFEKVTASGSFDVEIIADSGSSRVEIDAESNIVPVIRTEIHGNELEIDFENHTWITTHKQIRIRVFTSRLSGMHLSGSGTMTAGNFSGSSMEAEVSGSGKIFFSFTGQHVDFDISGSGKITGTGKVVDQVMKVSGSGDLGALDMEAENSTIHISGSGSANVFATKTLNAEISGSGNVTYKGSPSVNSSISGSGKVIKW